MPIFSTSPFTTTPIFSSLCCFPPDSSITIYASPLSAPYPLLLHQSYFLHPHLGHSFYDFISKKQSRGSAAQNVTSQLTQYGILHNCPSSLPRAVPGTSLLWLLHSLLPYCGETKCVLFLVSGRLLPYASPCYCS